MATHSSVLAWRIPGTGSLVGCHLWGHTELDTTEATSAAAINNLENGIKKIILFTGASERVKYLGITLNKIACDFYTEIIKHLKEIKDI